MKKLLTILLFIGIFTPQAYNTVSNKTIFNSLSAKESFIELFDNQDIPETNIVKSNNGTLWIGTSDSLYKSDNGSDFTKLDWKWGKQADNIAITSLVVDLKGTIWVGTLVDGVYKSYDNGFTFQKVNSFNSDSIITSIAIDYTGTVWISDQISGVYKSTDGVNFIKITIFGIKTITIDSKGIVWLGARTSVNNDGTLYQSIDRLNFIEVPETKGIVNAVTIDGDGTIWVGTSTDFGIGKLYKSINNGKSFIEIISINEEVHRISCNDGQILVGTSSGLYKSTDSLKFINFPGTIGSVSAITFIGNAIYIGTATSLSNGNLYKLK